MIEDHAHILSTYVVFVKDKGNHEDDYIPKDYNSHQGREEVTISAGVSESWPVTRVSFTSTCIFSSQKGDICAGHRNPCRRICSVALTFSGEGEG